MKKNMIRACAVLGSTAAMTGMGSVTAFASDTAAGASASGGSTAMALFSTLGLPILLLVFLYLIMIRPQQKADKEQRAMQKSLQVGDEVVTIGDIVGIVLRVEEATETVILETGSDRLKIRLKQDAIKENVTAAEAAAAAKAEKDKKRTQLPTGKPKDE